MEPSNRFSILSPEIGMDSNRNARRREKNQNKEKNGDNFAKGNKNQQKVQENPANKSKKKKNDAEADLQALAFGIGKRKGGNKGNISAAKPVILPKEPPQKIPPKSKEKKGKENGRNSKPIMNGGIVPDDEWKKRDEEFVKLENEKALREAIILSKLEHEEIKSKEKTIPKPKQEKIIPAETKPPKEVKTKKKKDKPLTLSLDQFNSLKPSELADLRDPKPTPPPKPASPPVPISKPPKPPKERFFQDVEEATKSTLDREKSKESHKVAANQINQDLKIKKLTAEIEKSDFEIQALRLEVEALREELKSVKARNKKLCEVISLSELRTKGELVLELEKVTKSRDEFSQEVAVISAELEQEKTRASQLSQELKKLQGKKRSADSSSKC